MSDEGSQTVLFGKRTNRDGDVENDGESLSAEHGLV